MTGGNPHYLRYMMQVSGFDGIIRELVDNGVVYGGFSAGAMVAGTTIKYADLDREPHKEPVRIDEGLGLINGVIVPHWNHEDRRSYLNQVEAAYERDGLSITPLNDAQVMVVNNGLVEILE